jgi:hypothetical protein
VTAIAAVRRDTVELRRGRQYLRQISGTGFEGSFDFPHILGSGPMRSLVPWSRILSAREVVCAINTNPDMASTAWVTIDDLLHQAGDLLTCVFSTDETMKGTSVSVEARNGKAILLSVPRAGFVLYR